MASPLWGAIHPFLSEGMLMRTIKKRMWITALLLGLLACLAPGVAFAGTATDGITITDDNGVVWTYAPISGTENEVQLAYVDIPDTSTTITQETPMDMVIPSTITYEGTIYTVTEVGYNNLYGPNQEAGGNTNIFGSNRVTATTTNPYYHNDILKIKSLSIPATVKTIDQSAFMYAQNLASVTFGEGSKLVTIGGQAFMSCVKLTSIQLPAGLKSIASATTSYGYAFSGSGLASITIPASVETLGSCTFYNCASLTTVNFEDGSKLATLPPMTFYDNSVLASFSFGTGGAIATIGDQAFSGCTALSYLYVPKTVTTFSGSFGSCTNLNLEFEDASTITAIGASAFGAWTGLADLSLSRFSNVTTIGSGAFSGNGWTTLALPANLVTMGTTCFSKGAFSSVVVPSKVETVTGLDTNTALKKVVILGSGSSAGLLTIGSSAFKSDGALTSVQFSGNVKTLAVASANVFTGCAGLTDIVFTGDVSNIVMPLAAQFKAIKTNTGLTFYAYDAPYDASAATNAALPTWCNTNGFAYKQLVDISGITAVIDTGTYTYDGTAHTPSITVKNGDTTLVQDSDYQVVYDNATSAGTVSGMIYGKGVYSAYSKSFTYTIGIVDLSAASVVSLADETYTGTALTPLPVVTCMLNDLETILVKDTDYTVSYSDNTNAGTATVTITGKGNFSGTKTATFTIKSAQMTSCTIAPIADQAYTSSAIVPAVTVTDGDKTLVKDTDYSVTAMDNTTVGTATVKVVGCGNYEGVISTTFNIVTCDVASCKVSTIPDQVYRGTVLEPTLTVTDTSGNVLIKNTDYSVTYLNNAAVGTATVAIAGLSNYSGTQSVTFTILEPISITSATVSAIPKQVYTGSALTPEPIVTLDGRTLVKGSDYTLAYANNTSSGTARVTATGIGLYTGSVTSIFTIVSFPDIDTGAWYVTDGWLSYVIGHGLMTGYSDTGNFEPYGNITRGQVATILYRYACSLDSTLISTYGSTTDASKYASKTVFTDEGAGTYYTAAINWAYAVGIMTGDSSTGYTTVRPDDSVTREDLCLMIYRYVKSVDPTLALHTGSVDYSSVIGIDTVDFWATDAVKWCASWGIIGGVNEGGTYHMNPTDTAWRASMAKMITVTLRDVMAG